MLLTVRTILKAQQSLLQGGLRVGFQCAIRAIRISRLPTRREIEVPAKILESKSPAYRLEGARNPSECSQVVP